MNKNFKKRFPKWINKINSNHKLILTNDLDSLFTVALLKKLFKCEIGMFYDFESLYSTQRKFNKQDIIGCDLAIEDNEIKTLCNHVTKMWHDDTINPLSANPNNIAGIYGGRYQTNYTEKYCGSTTLVVLSLYDAFSELLLDGHKELTDTQKMILISIDSYFYGKYFMNGLHFYQWQKALNLELFNDVLDKYSKSDLVDFQKEYSLKGEIYISDNDLETTLNLDFLKEHFPMLDFNINYNFVTQYNFTDSVKQNYWTSQSKHDLEGDVFSLSVTSQNTIRYTII